jgi:hypothetical protein
MPAIPFVANVPKYDEDPNNGQPYLVADIIVEAIAYTDERGAAQSVDINSLTCNGTDVTEYVYECHPDIWEYMKQEALARYLTPNNVTS